MAKQDLSNRILYRHLNSLFDKSIELKNGDASKLVIFSDLHMGDGSSKDDFKPNSTLFKYILENYYKPKGFTLILNGDVEELQRFKLKKIREAWNDLFEIFRQFAAAGKLFKIVGNHDLNLLLEKGHDDGLGLFHSIKINWHGNHIFIFHGHQASGKYLKYNKLLGITLKYLANPLGIKNYSVSHDSRKQYTIERKVYNFSSRNKIVSVIGHTHRPLFESLSKGERLKFKIEQLCREFVSVSDEKMKKKIKKSIKIYKKDLKKIYKKEKGEVRPGNVYDSVLSIPCLFNSGCVIGKRGVTTLEIDRGNISLIHWFDREISRKYLKSTGYEPEKMKDTNYYRMVINRESLDYIFTRIKLLA